MNDSDHITDLTRYDFESDWKEIFIYGQSTGCLLKEVISFTFVYVVSQHPRWSSQDKDAKSKFSNFPFNFIVLL